MANNKVIFGDETIMDISDTTATEDDVIKGATFYGADGKKKEGAVVVAPIDSELSKTSENPVQNKVITSKIEEVEETAKMKTFHLAYAADGNRICKLVQDNADYTCKGFFYNTDIGGWCEFEGLYKSNGGSEENEYFFGYCDIRGLHDSSHDKTYFIDEYGLDWYSRDRFDALGSMAYRDVMVYGDNENTLLSAESVGVSVGGQEITLQDVIDGIDVSSQIVVALSNATLVWARRYGNTYKVLVDIPSGASIGTGYTNIVTIPNLNEQKGRFAHIEFNNRADFTKAIGVRIKNNAIQIFANASTSTSGASSVYAEWNV